MKIAVSSTGKDLNDLVDPRFSKCRYYLLVDTLSCHTKAVENPSSYVCVWRDKTAGDLVAGEQPDVVLTGHIGRKAAGILLAAGVKIYTGASGKIISAIEAFQSGVLEAMTDLPDTPP